MNNKNPLYIVFGIVIGICISLTLTCSYAKMTRMKTPEQRAITIIKHKKGLTLKQLDKRVTKIEKYIEKEEKLKYGYDN